MSKKKETAPTTVEAKQKGRKSNPTSKRQMKMAEREAKKIDGTLKKGRPAVANSKRQIVLAEREAKRAAGIEVKKGRPAKAKVEKPAKVKKVKVVDPAIEIIEAA
jgi:hypothetical protein